MEAIVVSYQTGATIGVLRFVEGQAAIYDPITAKKKYIITGMDYSEDFVLPKKTSEERLGSQLEKGLLCYDTTDNSIWLGDGTTYGGVRVCGTTTEDNLTQMIAADRERMDGLEERCDTAEARLNMAEDAISGKAEISDMDALAGRVSDLESAVGTFESQAREILGIEEEEEETE